ncbi:MAG: PEGA domain-containing protein [Gemmatimonadetes bacterium]|nr:MAG: PEGA domain-containing protein [Gemmatimonadota bacterium]
MNRMISLSLFVLIFVMATSTFASTVTGIVTDAESGDALAGVFMALHARHHHPMNTVTDENGVYTFENVEADTYILTAGLANYERFETEVVVGDGETVEVNIALVPLDIPEGAVIGTVVDSESGEAIAGAMVSLRVHRYYHHVRTDETGAFQFNHVPAGEAELEAYAFGYEEYETEFEIGEDETIEMTVEMTALNIESGNVMGTVLDAESGEPVVDARVVLHGERGRHPHSFFALTDETGAFAFENIPAGLYELSVRVFGYERYDQELEVVADETVNITVELVPFQEPTFGALTVTVVDAETQEPVSRARVSLIRTERPGFHSHRFTDEAGLAEFNRVPTGDYYLRVHARGYDTAEAEVTIMEAETTELTLEITPTAPPAYGSVSGFVTDEESGEAIAGARVVLRREGFPGHHGRRMYVTRTAEDGSFMFDEVLTGNYRIWASMFGYERVDYVEIEVLEGENTTVDFALTPLAPPAFGTVTGTVFDAETGLPLAGAHVRAVAAGHHGRPIFTLTDSLGMYTLDVPVGVHDFRAGRFGYLPEVVEDVEIMENETITLDFILTPSDSVEIFGGFSVHIPDQSSLGVQFIDQTDGLVTDWLWSFGDGTTSHEANPDHIYTEEGVYTVTLEVWSNDSWDLVMEEDIVVVQFSTSAKPEQTGIAVPQATRLTNYPNPFNPKTTIAYELPQTSSVNLSIYDITGRLIWQALNESQEAGSYTIEWNGVDQNGHPVQSGVYLYRLTTDSGSLTNSMVLLK